MSHLAPRTRLPTTGAHAVEAFTIDGDAYLAVAQFARDVSGQPANVSGGDSHVPTLVLRRSGDRWETHQQLAVPGGVDAEFLRIGARRFLATASLRAGAGPYAFAVDSTIFEWVDGRFTPLQRIATVAAKQWRHVQIDGRHFLALAQGGLPPPANRPSTVFEWNGERFVAFQEIASAWGYDWHAFEIDGRHFLAHADHAGPSMLHRWNGTRFVEHQMLAERHGRGFASFRAEDTTFLACAVLHGDSMLLRWDGRGFVVHQALAGEGGRRFVAMHGAGGLHVVRINHLLGEPPRPTARLLSQLYAWRDGRLVLQHSFETSGGTDATVVRHDGRLQLVVANGLAPDLRFGAHVDLYDLVERDAGT